MVGTFKRIRFLSLTRAWGPGLVRWTDTWAIAIAILRQLERKQGKNSKGGYGEGAWHLGTGQSDTYPGSQTSAEWMSYRISHTGTQQIDAWTDKPASDGYGVRHHTLADETDTLNL